MEIKCYKGAKDSDITTINVEDDMLLCEVREMLIQKGFIEPDNRQKGIAYRFVVKQTKKDPKKDKMLLKDVVMPLEMEDIPPVSRIWGPISMLHIPTWLVLPAIVGITVTLHHHAA